MPCGSTESRPTISFRGLNVIPGSARVSRVGEGVPPSWTFREDYFGGTPKPARETRALPGGIRSLARDLFHCVHSSSAFGSPRKNASASPAKWREPVIKTRSLVRCAAEIASATDGVVE